MKVDPLVATIADRAFVVAHLLVIGAFVGDLGGIVVAGLFLVIHETSSASRHTTDVHG